MAKTALNTKQKRFCELYVSEDFFGNGVGAYMKAYASDNYASAKTNASKLLANVSITEHIASLLDSTGLNDSFVDKQLYFLMLQSENLPVKMQAIREYYKVRSCRKPIEQKLPIKTRAFQFVDAEEYIAEQKREKA